ncbi:MAG: LarC family nickel insertion protein [Pseudobutyrivibrio sp.]|nr:LarC family nickel insertion protein [Pseudobutyrivibrio sp.]
MESLYFETTSGISGDMTVAALLDLGADQKVLMTALDSIKAQGFEIKISRVKKSGLDCLDFDVVLDRDHDGHDHDMNYLYGHLEGHHDHEDHEGHHHEHHHQHHHEHHHRGMKEINEILDQVDMTSHAREIAGRIFEVIAQAESKAHGLPVDQVHFHEVGAIDSIVDVVAIAVCFDNLGIENVIVPYLTEGQGTVRCQHGIIPVPVPAVINIASAAGIALKITQTQGELVTPTGAATVAALRTSHQLPDVFTVKRTGLGAGKRDYGLAGFLRIMVIETPDA